MLIMNICRTLDRKYIDQTENEEFKKRQNYVKEKLEEFLIVKTFINIELKFGKN